MTTSVPGAVATGDQRAEFDEDAFDGPPSRCTGDCSTIGRLKQSQWDDQGFCRFCGEDGNA